MHFNERAGAGPKAHTPGQRGLRAESLPVDEVAPAADTLAQQQSHDAKVRHGPELQLFHTGVTKGHDDAHNDRTVNGKAAVPHGHDLSPVQTTVRRAVQVQVEKHIVDAGADDARGHRPEHHVQHVVLREAKALGLLHAKQQTCQHGHRQDDAVPVHAMADVEGDGIDVAFPVAEQAGKADGHITQSLQFGLHPFFLSCLTWGRSR